MAKTVCVPPYANGNPDYQDVINRRLPIETQVTALGLLTDHIKTNPNREDEMYDHVASLVFSWPWSLANIDQVLQMICAASGMPDWAKVVARQVAADIKSHELTNTWVNPFTR